MLTRSLATFSPGSLRAARTLTKVAVLGTAVFAFSACSNLNSTQERTLSGGAIGAGAGAVAGIATGGCMSCGAVIGGAIGAGAGYLYDQVEKKK